MKSIILFLLITPVFLFGQEIKEYKKKNKAEWIYEVYDGFKDNKDFKHGKYKKYSGDKQKLKEKGFYKDNLKDGVWEFYNFNGELIQTGKFEEGVKTGEWTFNNSKGNTVQKYDFTDNKVTYHNEVENGIKYKLNNEIHSEQYISRLPLFIGGVNQFYNYLGMNIRYPAEARENNIQGAVVLSFDVNIDGSISNIEVIQSLGGGCDEESIRVLELSNKKWAPAISNGKQVKSNIIFPVFYKLSH